MHRYASCPAEWGLWLSAGCDRLHHLQTESRSALTPLTHDWIWKGCDNDKQFIFISLIERNHRAKHGHELIIFRFNLTQKNATENDQVWSDVQMLHPRVFECLLWTAHTAPADCSLTCISWISSSFIIEYVAECVLALRLLFVHNLMKQVMIMIHTGVVKLGEQHRHLPF